MFLVCKTCKMAVFTSSKVATSETAASSVLTVIN